MKVALSLSLSYLSPLSYLYLYLTALSAVRYKLTAFFHFHITSLILVLYTFEKSLAIEQNSPFKGRSSLELSCCFYFFILNCTYSF